MPISLRVRKVDASSNGRSDGAADGGIAGTLTFDGPRVVLGRGAGSDVRLPDASVSHRHASVRVDRSAFTLVDEGSTNGTFVGGVRLSQGAPRVLRSGDLIRLGRVWIEVSIDSGPPTQDLAGATRELALAMVAQAMERGGEDRIAKVHVVEGRDRGAALSLALEDHMYICGRGEECDLSLADADASREHVGILRRASSVFLRDLGSKNGAFVGSEPLARDRDVAWKPQLALSLGKTVLALEEPIAAALALLESAEDDALDVADIPPPPSLANATSATNATNATNATGATNATNATGASGDDAPASKATSNDAAPIAEIPAAPPSSSSKAAIAKAKAASLRPKKRRSGWSFADLVVVAAAIVVLLLSLAGMAWLLK